MTEILRAAWVGIVALAGGACMTTRYGGPALTPTGAEMVRRENPEASIVVEGIYPPPEDLARAPHHLSVSLVKQGAGVGALIAGAVMGIFTLIRSPCTACGETRIENVELAGRYLGLPVLVLATGIGALVGSCTTYTFE